ncbi:MAG TPA: hypothetical protein VN645_15585 [Steroidobacteraceae bacterium]|nr:hypothetical protein [Steroidobacteraceae bacterium]
MSRIVALIAGWLGVLTACLGAQTTGVVGTATRASSAETDEIVVHGTRLYELRAAIVAAEDRFYARYNELNKVNDFDIECTVDAPTGTRFKQRTCLTRLQQRAQQENGREFVQMLQDQSAGLTGTAPITDPNTAMLARYEEYKRNVLYLLKMNPELRQLVRERDAAEKRYNEERRKRFKGRLASFE